MRKPVLSTPQVEAIFANLLTQHFTPSDAAEILEIELAKISTLTEGRFAIFSTSQLFRFLDWFF